jgi:hypothetical protein
MRSDPLVVTRQDLIEADDRADGWIRREVRTGAAVRAAPGVLLLGRPDLPSRISAALAHAGPEGIVTGWAGCALRDVPGADPLPQVAVLVPAEIQRVSTSYVRIMSTVRQPAPTLIDGVRVAPAVRCVVDAARQLDGLRPIRHLVMSALASGAVPLADLDGELAAGARNGSRLVRRALLDAARGAASAPEAELADVVLGLARRRQLPPFLLNPEVWLGDRLVGRPDGWFTGVALGWEVDSRAFHSADDTFDATLDRHGRFGAAGVLLVHVTPRRFRQLGAAYGKVLVDAVSARRRDGSAPLPELRVVPRGPQLP